MPKSKTARKSKAKARRPAVAIVTEPGHACVVTEGTVTHVLVPVEDYQRLQLAEMAESAFRDVQDPSAKWIDADDARLAAAGERIARARKSAGLTQTQLGERLNIPQSQISRIERNPDHTTVRTLKRLAKALNVDVRALIS